MKQIPLSFAEPEQVLILEYTESGRCMCCDMPIFDVEAVEPLGQDRLHWWVRHMFRRTDFETCDCRYFDEDECTCGKCCDHCICGAFGLTEQEIEELKSRSAC